MTVRIALGTLILGAGVLWLLSTADVVDLSYATWVGILLIAIGVAIVVTPGRHGFLVFLGILVVLAGVPAVLVHDELFEGGIGDEVVTPRTAADLEPFHHGIGKLTVDLTEPGLELDGRTVEASVGIGELVVLVPVGVDATVDAHVGVGNAEAFDEREDGLGVDLSTISGTSGSQEVDLELEVGIGDIRVERD